MNFGQSITTCMGKYVTFSGRASRSEFWWFYLFTVLISWGATLVEAAMFGVGTGILSSIVSLAFILPTLAASSRRLHDIGKSGWWFLIALTGVGVILLIVWWASDAKPAGERFSEV